MFFHKGTSCTEQMQAVGTTANSDMSIPPVIIHFHKARMRSTVTVNVNCYVLFPKKTYGYFIRKYQRQEPASYILTVPQKPYKIKKIRFLEGSESHVNKKRAFIAFTIFQVNQIQGN